MKKLSLQSILGLGFLLLGILILPNFAQAVSQTSEHGTSITCVAQYSSCHDRMGQFILGDGTTFQDLWIYHEAANDDIDQILEIYDVTTATELFDGDGTINFTIPNLTPLGWFRIDLSAGGAESYTLPNGHHILLGFSPQGGEGNTTTYRGGTPHVNETFDNDPTSDCMNGNSEFCIRLREYVGSAYVFPDQELAYAFSDPETPVVSTITITSPADASTATTTLPILGFDYTTLDYGTNSLVAFIYVWDTSSTTETWYVNDQLLINNATSTVADTMQPIRFERGHNYTWIARIMELQPGGSFFDGTIVAQSATSTFSISTTSTIPIDPWDILLPYEYGGETPVVSYTPAPEVPGVGSSTTGIIGWLFTPSDDILTYYMNTGYEWKNHAPFSYFYDFGRIIASSTNPTTASSSISYGVTLSNAWTGTGSTTLSILSSSIISQVTALPAWTTIYTLTQYGIWIGCGMYFYFRVKNLII